MAKRYIFFPVRIGFLNISHLTWKNRDFGLRPSSNASKKMFLKKYYIMDKVQKH
jgi:hypothetical protein